MNHPGGAARLAAGLAVLLVAGCHYVKQDEYDATISDLRNNQAALRRDVDANKADLANLRAELEAKFQKYDATISQLQGRVRVDVAAHFDYRMADLRDEDKPVLDDFASVIKGHHPDALVTVEGFTDPAGSAAYNRKLGLRRAETVRDYLVQNGLNADQVRAVSYGKDRNRQVVPGASRDQGAPNRRVALVIESVGSGETAPAAAEPPAGSP
jgi:peptidoglycan-associated lipoprotein